MANTRFYQIFSKREAVPGVIETGLYAAANGIPVFKDPQLTYDQETFEREVQLASLSPLKAMNGGTQGAFSFGLELAGTTESGSPAPAPRFFELLEACGMKKVALYGGTWSGTFTGTATGSAKHLYHGQLLQNAGATTTLRVVHDTYEGQTTVYFEVVSGTQAAEAYFPTTSDSTVGPVLTITGGSVLSQKGWYLTPISNPVLEIDVASVTGANSIDDVYVGATSKAVIQALQATTGGADRRFRVLDGTPAVAGETFDNVTQTGTIVCSTPAYAQPEFPTLSMGLVEDGRLKRIRGARGTCSLSAERGKPAILNFQFKGLVSTPLNAGPLSGVVNYQKTPPRFFGADLGVLLGSYKTGEPGYFSHSTAHVPAINALTLDQGGTTNLQEDATQSTGYTGTAQPGARASQGSMTVEIRPEARFPFIGKLIAGESMWLKLQIRDTLAGNNNFMISAPGITGTGASPGNQNGFGRDDFAFGLSALQPNGGDGDGRELVLSYLYSSAATW